MTDRLGKWIRPTELLGTEALDSMLAGGEVLEQDERGYKVVRLRTGDIFKIFRVRRKISGARIYTHARRFFRNAERLHQLGVNTVTCKRLYHFSNSDDTAVLYSPLAGYTIRKLLEGNLLNQEMASALGAFIARLHQSGIHFRSLHMGNILVMPDGQYGLIDISDMSIYPWPLFCNTRVRNFRHLCRYPDDISHLGKLSWQSLQEGYFSASQLGAACESKIRRALTAVVSFDD
jgi:tRNA A-37 threonylcarbamoyl transferase component Bud32